MITKEIFLEKLIERVINITPHDESPLDHYKFLLKVIKDSPVNSQNLPTIEIVCHTLKINKREFRKIGELL